MILSLSETFIVQFPLRASESKADNGLFGENGPAPIVGLVLGQTLSTGVADSSSRTVSILSLLHPLPELG